MNLVFSYSLRLHVAKDSWKYTLTEKNIWHIKGQFANVLYCQSFTIQHISILIKILESLVLTDVTIRAETIHGFLVFEYSLELMIKYSQMLATCSHTHLTCFVPTLNSLQLFK